MQELTPSTRVELDIQRLLKSQASLDSIVEQLISVYGATSLHQDEIEAFALFLFHAGYYTKLTHVLISFSGRDLKIPWGLLCEALFRASPAVPEQIKIALIAGAEQQGRLNDLARSDKLDLYDERLAAIKKNRPQQLRADYEQRRSELISTLETLRAQGLQAEEGQLLERLKKIFPEDPEVAEQQKKRAQLKALNLLHEIKPNRPSWIPIDLYLTKDSETLVLLKNIEESMHQYLSHETNSNVAAQLKKDFAIAHVIWGNYDAALNFQNPHSPEKSLQWLRMEILLLNRKFIDLLSALLELERRWSDDPEATFGIHYLRAQAYWGLGQKQLAIEIMENITITRPSYRSSNSLLTEWKAEAP